MGAHGSRFWIRERYLELAMFLPRRDEFESFLSHELLAADLGSRGPVCSFQCFNRIQNLEQWACDTEDYQGHDFLSRGSLLPEDPFRIQNLEQWDVDTDTYPDQPF